MSDIDSLESIASSGVLSGYPGLWIRLVSATLGTYTSTGAASATGQVAFSVPRPAGVYEVWTSPDGSAWTDTGEQYQVFASALAQQSLTPNWNFQTAYRKGPVTDADHPDFGTPGTSVALAAAFAFMAAQGGGELVLTPGRTYSTTGITAVSNLKVKAKGAFIQHTGPGVLLHVGQNSTGTFRFEWHGGILIAAQSVGTTTDVVNVQNASYCVIDPDGIQGGNTLSAPTTKYATNGIHVYGRKFPVGGNYYNQIGQGKTLITGCTNDGVYVDGWDSVNSPTSGSYCNDNLYTNLFCQYNNVGVQLDGAQGETFVGGDCEANTSYGLSMFSHPVGCRFLGLWIEANNGGSPNEQITVDTSTYATSQQSNTFRGTCGTVGTIAYWMEFDNGTTRALGGRPAFYATTSGGPVIWGLANFNPLLDFQKVGDTQPQLRPQLTGSGGNIKYGPGGTTAPDCGFGRQGAAQVGTDSATTLSAGLGFRLSNFGTAQAGSLYMGSGTPASASGNNGDIYFNTAGAAGTTIYQKRSGAWVGIV